MKCILAPLVGNPTDSVTLEAALSTARMFGAHIDALYVRSDPDDIAAWGVGSAIPDLQARAEQRERLAERAFERFCAKHLHIGTACAQDGVSATFLSTTGRQLELYPAFGRTSDLIVFGVATDQRELTWDVLKAVLFSAGRPVMFAREQPSDPGFGTVAIAWKNTPEAARAIGVAGSFISRASRVIVFCVDEEKEADRESAARLIRNLQRYNQKVVLQRVSSHGKADPAAMLLDSATAWHAGLLVMGGYGHSRMREWVFGGFTNHVLRCATLPVLMMH
jgi:nucleotide-binding universal stress UspA family protein